MRLQLIVQRHRLPPTQILWTVGAAVKPPTATPGTSITISQFLEQVNEIIPLEADQWGLEDYAVEVQGFECLHFSELSQVLRENDEVCVRPLQTSDLRVRKFSGRHQISADGKHLIDGVAFGRPFLKRADRPAVRIPPRKRRRIIYSDDEDSIMDVENNEKQVVVRAKFNNTDEGDDEDESEDDEDFDPEAEDDEGLDDELEDLQDDLNPDEEGFGDAARGTRNRSQRRAAGLGLDLLGDGLYKNPLLDQYSQDEPFAAPQAFKVGKRRSTEGHKDWSSKNPKPALSSRRINRSDSTGSNKSVRFEDGEIATPATILGANDEDDEDDDEDFSGLDGSNDIDESDKENTEPAKAAIDYLETSDSSSSFSEFDPSEEEIEEGDETSSSGISSSESDSDSAPEQLSSNARTSGRMNEHSSASSSMSSSGSNSDQGKKNKRRKSATDDSTPNTSVGEIATGPRYKQINPPVPPGSGKQSTRMRNIRRKASAALKFHKHNGDLPENATNSDLIRFKEKEGSSLPPWIQEMRSKLDAVVTEDVNEKRNKFEKKSTETAEIATKRQALLNLLQSGGDIEVSTENYSSDTVLLAVNDKSEAALENVEGEHDNKPASHHASPSVEAPERRQAEGEDDNGPVVSKQVESDLDSSILQVPDSLPKDTNFKSAQSVEAQPVDVPFPSSTPPDASNTTAPVPSASQKRRAKLDIAGSKRLLFGSLGLKAPKTKDDESALRAKLMKDVRPVKPVKERVAEIEAVEAATVPAENDDESWKDKIELAAVECCHDGIELSTPPFPFVQRWDPQQQGTYSKKGRKNKKRKRMDESYYEENYEEKNEESPKSGSPSKVARQERYDANMEQPQFDVAAFEHDQIQQNQEWSHGQSLQDSAAANEQLLRETSESAAYAITESDQASKAEELPDLPSLPVDLTGFQDLKKHHCLAGAIIAFKQFFMSAETNWQPGISGYLTAAVRELQEDGTLLLALARRDQPKNEARYHEDTGERLYGKFEMPGFDEVDAGNDRSKIEMPFNELISPLLVRPANNGQSSSEEKPVTVTSDLYDTLVGDEAQRAPSEAQALVSFDSTMDNPIHLEAEIAVPTESARQEIVEMIQDAGWRSSLGSGVDKKLEINGHAGSSEPESHNGAVPLAFQSPTFGGFDSSPHVNDTYSALSPLLAEFPASHTKQTPEAEAARQQSSEENAFSAFAASKSAVEYPTLPYSNEESEFFQEQRQSRSVSLENDIQSIPQDSVSPPPIRRGRGQSNLSPILVPLSQKSSKSVPKTVCALDGADDSSDELPELFSQAFEARMSQEPAIKDESSQKYDMYKLPKAKGGLSSSQKSINNSGSQKTTLSGFEEEEADNDRSFRPSQSEVAQSSQAVDLTISSDPLEPMYDENKGMGSYKSSGGWVDKLKANMDIGVARRSSKRKTRSKSAMAY